MSDWETLRTRATEAFNGDAPGADLEQELIDAYADHPHAVTKAIDKIANAYETGASGISSPWAVARAEVRKATTARANVKAKPAAEREKAIQRANTWMTNAGIHYDRWAEVEDDLFGHNGLLHVYDTKTLRKTMLELWQESRPVGEQLDREELERAQAWKAHHPEHAAKHIPQEPVFKMPGERVTLEAVDVSAYAKALAPQPAVDIDFSEFDLAEIPPDDPPLLDPDFPQ